MKNRKTAKGFTLIEILLVVALFAAIAGFSFPIYQSFQAKNNLDIAANTVAQSLRRAQLLSQSMEGDSVWGLKIQNGSVVVFKGTTYATRDTAYDEFFEVPSTINPTGINEITFSKLNGEPSTTGTITLSSTTTTLESRVITINSKGMVSF